MDKAKIFLEDGVAKLVNCIFYLYNSKYYFLYTENEVDENGYVRLYLVKVGKETTNSANGPVETGNMIGIEVPTDDEWKEVQGSISKIVNSKKSKIEDKDIQYLPIDMLVNLKITSKKSFRLLANIIENDFGIKLAEDLNQNDDDMANATDNTVVENQVVDEQSTPIEDSNLNKPIEEEISVEKPTVENINQEIDDASEENSEQSLDQIESVEEDKQQDETAVKEEVSNEATETDEYVDSDIIIDYRTRFFEEQEKNKRLNEEIDKLKKKLENIIEIIKED